MKNYIDMSDDKLKELYEQLGQRFTFILDKFLEENNELMQEFHELAEHCESEGIIKKDWAKYGGTVSFCKYFRK